jgi:hypothetical protein
MEKELWMAIGLIAGLAAAWLAGIRSMGKAGGRREKLSYTVLLAWCGYILLTVRLGGVPLTLADLNKALFIPLGQWVKLMVMGSAS